MEKFQKLSRAEMKNVLGGDGPENLGGDGAKNYARCEDILCSDCITVAQGQSVTCTRGVLSGTNCSV